ncbi:hypothetical protein I4U23_026154 [Adineta vaga]|nr:hypothetical protein I4U23_026154 [Adineta vaga]
MNLLTCNSCATLLYHSLAVLIEIVFLFLPSTTRFCSFRAYIYYSSCATISYSYVVQAISRYFLTIRYKNKMLITFRINWILVLFNWIISGIVGLIFLLIPLAFQYEYESRMCLLTSKNFSTAFSGVMLAFCIPFLIIIFLYALILYHTTKHGIQLNIFTTIRLRRNLQVFQKILILVFILGIGGTPYFICVIMNSLIALPWPLYSLSILCVSLSAALESLALFFSNFYVRTQFLRMIQCQPRANMNSMSVQHHQLIEQKNHLTDIP